MNHTVLSNCADNAIGNRLLVFDAADTVLLTPTHIGVPWVTVNGDGSSDVQDQVKTNLTKAICQFYKVNLTKSHFNIKIHVFICLIFLCRDHRSHLNVNKLIIVIL